MRIALLALATTTVMVVVFGSRVDPGLLMLSALSGIVLHDVVRAIRLRRRARREVRRLQ